ncbi:glycosyltransferase [Aliarcobacter butzleri]|uniref:glycosyltransferase family 2 protein n=1 Tax=Aliarcobacter butzleri TaxID=28197 RepID=UPI0021B62521|nr:glycosyltransferase [Aliarcobacter butzleri]MCT7650809.1 glycosyltransferase [Aliarcobacter butzleri]
MNSVPKVSVCVVTYNHEKYIRECLESIVTQKCDFDFEVIVGEDCSTDNTRAIVQEYVDKYPNIVKPLFHEKNVGASDNYFLVHNQAKGEYICHMDGDDYALPGKLQAQADFMDKTPDCNICFHRVKVLFPDGTIKDDLIDYEKIKDGFERKDLLMYMAVATNSSKMYRKEVKHFDIPCFEILDTYAHIEQVKEGKAYFVSNRVLGVYRKDVGISSTGNKTKLLQLKQLVYFTKKYPKYKEYINTAILIGFLADLINWRNTKKDYFYMWIKTFKIKSIFNFIRVYNTIKMFKLK